MGSHPIKIQLRKILWEILAGKCCGTGRRAKSQFKKGSDFWKCSIWNSVMGEPNQSRSSSGKSCRKILWENVVGQGGGEKANLRKAVIGENVAFGIG